MEPYEQFMDLLGKETLPYVLGHLQEACKLRGRQLSINSTDTFNQRQKIRDLAKAELELKRLIEDLEG